jgi:hypothetical protein
MNLVPFSIYSYINIVLSIVFILSTLILKTENMQLLVNIIPVILISLSAYSISKKLDLTSNLKKNVILGSFVGSIIVSFAPYILQYSNSKQMLFASLTFTILLLINIFLVKLETKEK